MAVLLAAPAGWVDAVGWLAIGTLFLAHMSCNSASAAIHAARGQWGPFLHRLGPIPCFVFGLALGRVIGHVLERRRVRRRLASLLAIEGGFIVAAFIAWVLGALDWMTWPLAAAMGVQSAALRHVAGHDVRTTFVTGMIVAIVDECIAVALRLGGDSSFVRLYGSVWLAFCSGAFAAAATLRALSFWTLGVPLAVLAFVLVVEVVRPLARPETHALR